MLNLSTFSAFADDQVADITATDTSQDVAIDLPDDLPAGFHTATTEVTDPDTGEVTTEDISFCKDNAGEIHWDNICPDLDVVVDPTTLENVTDVKSLPAYSPASEPTKTSQTQVAGFTALSVLSAGGAAAAASGAVSGGASSGGGGGNSGSSGSGNSRTEARREEGKEESGVEGAEGGEEESGAESQEKLLHASHVNHSSRSDSSSFEDVDMGIGDKSFTWKAPLTPTLDSAFVVASLRIAKVSPLIAKMLIDASYLRAMFGSLSIFTIPLSFFIGFQALVSNNSQPIPPAWKIMAAMTVLGLFDSFAGLLSALVFVSGVLISGHVNTLSNVLTILAYAAICASPAVMAGSFRPLRRRVGRHEHPWERAIDYVLAALLTGWTLSKLVGTLNVIAAKQLPIVAHANQIGLIVGLAVVARMLFEDISTYLYPQRISKFEIQHPRPSTVQQYVSVLIKGAIFGLVMKAFVGLNLQLFLGTAFFVLPNILKLSAGHILPKSRMLHFAVPKGAVRIVTMTILGTLFAKLSQHTFKNPHDFLTWGFVLLSVPGFVFALLGLISDDKNSKGLKHHSRGIWLYRIGGLVVLYLIIEMVLGKDITTLLKHSIGLK